jgi:hypothetical protein
VLIPGAGLKRPVSLVPDVEKEGGRDAVLASGVAERDPHLFLRAEHRRNLIGGCVQPVS